MFFYIDSNQTKEPLFFSKLEYAKSRAYGSDRSDSLYMPYMPYMPKKSYTLFQNLCLTLSKYIIFDLCLYARQILNITKNSQKMSDLYGVFS